MSRQMETAVYGLPVAGWIRRGFGAALLVFIGCTITLVSR